MSYLHSVLGQLRKIINYFPEFCVCHFNRNLFALLRLLELGMLQTVKAYDKAKVRATEIVKLH